MKIKCHKVPVFSLFPLSLGILLLTFAVAQAQSSRDAKIEAKFAEADTNHDGQLTLAEAKAGMPRLASRFDKIDVDQNGYLTVVEIKAFANR